ncbi:hypothetical protein A4A49_62849, partial [Nicotiana attenuata]
IKWTHPIYGTYKLNTDGAYNINTNCAGIGGVIRNSNGDWVIGYWKYSYAINHTYMEILALQQGLQLAIMHTLRPIEIEIDSTEILQLIEHCTPIYQTLIDSCRCLLKKLGNPVGRHSFREANSVAHFLAKEGSKQTRCNNLSVFWQPPATICNSLQADKEA